MQHIRQHRLCCAAKMCMEVVCWSAIQNEKVLLYQCMLPQCNTMYRAFRQKSHHVNSVKYKLIHVKRSWQEPICHFLMNTTLCSDMSWCIERCLNEVCPIFSQN